MFNATPSSLFGWFIGAASACTALPNRRLVLTEGARHQILVGIREIFKMLIPDNTG